MKILIAISAFIISINSLIASQDAWDLPNKDLSHIKSVALYRGSFDPLHLGHASVIEECLNSGCSHVALFPAFGLGEKERTPLTIRTEMLELYAESDDISILDFDIAPEMESDLETLKEVRKKVVNWIQALQEKGVKVYKVLGGDAAYKEIEILPSKPPNVVDGYVLASRLGFPITEDLVRQYHDLGIEVIPVEPQHQELSSSWIRQQMIGGNDISLYVPEAVLKIIQKYRLYQE